MVFVAGQTLSVNIKNILPPGAKFASPPTYSSSNAAVFNPVAAPDGLTAQGPAASAGSTVITVTAAAEGIVRTISVDVQAPVVSSFDLEVVAAEQPPL
jgi:hypothetical protein